MLRRRLLGPLAVGLLAACAAPAKALTVENDALPPAQTLTIVNDANLGHHAVTRIERALVRQSRQLRRFWQTPLVRFGQHGWPLYLERHGLDPGAPGFHSDANGIPYAKVFVADAGYWWTEATSHEVMEMLANPHPDGQPFGSFGWQKEVCDPTAGQFYTVNGDALSGVVVEDFATPAWFAGGHGPYDWTRSIQRPGAFLKPDGNTPWAPVAS